MGRKFFKKMISGMCAAVLGVGLLSGNAVTADAMAGNIQIGTISAQVPFRDMTTDEMVAEMGTGWNLGNTMDGHTGFNPGETIWQNVETTQALIKSVHDMGFNTIRVPVTWGTMIDDANGYVIDEKWISRVQDIVDYAVNMNMYVIINIHHDGAEQSGWLRIAAEDFEPVKEKFAAVWEHIAERFKDYDEHLIFESMNEVTGDNSTTVAGDTARIMELNQIFVDTVRATGSNNEYRWLSVPGRYTNIAHSTDPAVGFDIPEDPTPNRIFVAVHYYDWTFGMLENMNDTDFDLENFNNVLYDFQKLQEKFTSKGIPVILGEYGTINKLNDAERAYHVEGINRICQNYGIVPVYWDQGWYDLSMQPDYSFTLVDRETGEEVYPSNIEAIMRGMFLPGREDLTDIVKDPEVNPITDLGTFTGAVTLTVGTVTDFSLAASVDKSAYNDVVLWKSADETVATVNPNNSDPSVWAANIHGTGIGRTVITAYSHSGQAQLEIPVEVTAADVSVDMILLEQNSYTLQEGQYVYLNARCMANYGSADLDEDAASAADDVFVTYRSADTSVATVSRLGKVVAKSAGSTYIIITASNGLTEVVPVTVEAGEAKAEISLALNVYYNDNDLNYFSNEVGKAITVTEDGQYTLSFDCASDLSGNAVNAGVTGLNNLTAIYIKDDSVTQGITKTSPLLSCDIMYDEIIVDGVSYAITQTEPKSALKASGILDTNDPINSWDGSVIEEVSVNNHVLNFTEAENPGRIELTFTLSNLVFDETAMEAAAEAPVESTEITVLSQTAAANTEPGTVSVQISPAGSGKVTFVSADPGSAYVSNISVEPVGDGVAVIEVYAMSGQASGTTMITAYTANGLTAEAEVDTTYTAVAPELTGSLPETPEESVETPEESVESSPESSAAVTEPPTESENTPESPESESATAEARSGGYSVGTIVGVAVLCIVLFVGVFFGTTKIAGGKKKDEN